MEEKFNLNQLLQKPIAMMTGEELCFLIAKYVESTEKSISQVAPKGNFYGIEGIARVFGCSVPTANRIKKSGIIDKAITQIGRKIVVDADRTVFGKGIRWHPHQRIAVWKRIGKRIWQQTIMGTLLAPLVTLDSFLRWTKI